MTPPGALRVLRAVVAHIERTAIPPTLREIGAALGIRSNNGVSDHLIALERRGLIVRPDSIARGIRVTAAGYAEAGSAANTVDMQQRDGVTSLRIVGRFAPHELEVLHREIGGLLNAARRNGRRAAR